MNRTLRIVLIFAALLALPAASHAAIPGNCTGRVFYFSTSGSDSNSGTSETSPWQHHPYSPGFAGNYSHTAGDCFIFRGGDVFHRSGNYIPLDIVRGGSGASVMDYYGVDPAWGTGTATGSVDTFGTIVVAHKPAINGSAGTEGNPFSSSWTGTITINGNNYTIASVQSHDQLTLTTNAGTQSNVTYSHVGWVQPEFNDDNYEWGCGAAGPNRAIFYIESGSAWVTIDNFNAHGIEASDDCPTAIVDDENSVLTNNIPQTNETVQNSWLHGFCPPNTNGSFTGLDLYGAYGGDLNAENNVLTDLECPGAGSAITDINGSAEGNTIHDIDQSMLGNGHLVDNNVIYNIEYPVFGYSPDAHTNLNEMFADGGNYYTYNNLAYNFAVGFNFGGDMGWGGACSGANNGANFYFFNNVLISGSTADNMPIMVSNKSTGIPDCGAAYVWNNTLQYDVASSLIRFMCGGSDGTTAVLDFRNNHFITQASAANVIDFDCNNYVTLLNSNNPLQTNSVANAQGYMPTNWYQPTASGDATVGAGVNLSSQCSGALTPLCTGFTNSVLPLLNTKQARGSTFDAGAYQFGSSESSAPPPAPANVIATAH